MPETAPKDLAEMMVADESGREVLGQHVAGTATVDSGMRKVLALRTPRRLAFQLVEVNSKGRG